MGSRIDQDMPAPPLSIVIPVYNESQRIARTLSELFTYLDDASITAEIIVADDGSTDDTVAIVSAIAAEQGRVTLLSLAHGGKARAVLTGLRRSSGDIVGFMDADLATPLPTIQQTMVACQAGADVVIASREGTGADRVGEPWYRHAMGRIFNGLVRLALLPSIQDTQCGFKFMTRTSRDLILPKVRLYTSDGTIDHARVTAFDVELLYIAYVIGLHIEVIPVTWQYGTQSKVNPIRDTIQNLDDVFRVWLNGKRGRYHH